MSSPEYDEESYDEEEYQEGEESDGQYDGEHAVDDTQLNAAKRRNNQSDSDLHGRQGSTTPRRVLVSGDESGPRDNHEDEHWSSNQSNLRESVHANRIMAMLDNSNIVMDTTQKLERMSIFMEKSHEEHRAFVRAVYGDILRRLHAEGPELEGESPTQSKDTKKKKKQMKQPKSLRDIARVVQSGVHRVQTQAKVAESLSRLQRPQRVRKILVDGIEVWMRRGAQEPENARIRNLLELISQMRSEVARLAMDRQAQSDLEDIEHEIKGIMITCRRADELTEEIDEFLLGDFSESQDLKTVVERWAITMNDLKIRLRKFTVSEMRLLHWDPFEIMMLRCAAAGDPGDVVLDLLADFDPDAWKTPYEHRRSIRRVFDVPESAPVMPREVRRSTAKRLSQFPQLSDTAQRYSVYSDERKSSIIPHARESIPSKRMSVQAMPRLSVMPFDEEDGNLLPDFIPEPGQSEQDRFFTPRLSQRAKQIRKQKQMTEKRSYEPEDNQSPKQPVQVTHLEGLHGFVNGDGDKGPSKLILGEDVRSHLIEAWSEVLDSRLVLENLNNMPRGRLISAHRFAEQLAFRPIDLGPRRGHHRHQGSKNSNARSHAGAQTASPDLSSLQRGMLDRKTSDGTAASFFNQKMLHLHSTV